MLKIGIKDFGRLLSQKRNRMIYSIIALFALKNKKGSSKNKLNKQKTNMT